MHVLHISENLGQGGAGLAARRLAAHIKEFGVHSSGLHAPGRLSDEFAQPLPMPGWPERISAQWHRTLGRNDTGLTRLDRLTGHPLFQKADLLHLHNLHGFYFDYRWLPALCALKPVVWTWHDMWPVTGHCAHAFDCQRWKQGCGTCPYPETYPAIHIDRTASEWARKRASMRVAKNLHIICPGVWGEAQAQTCFPSDSITVVPNGVELELYAAPTSGALRASWEVRPDQKILLAVADHLDNPFKNFRYVLEELARAATAHPEEYVLVTVGGSAKPWLSDLPLRVLDLGYVTDPELLANVFKSVDVFLCPSRAETQPLVILEAMAAGAFCIATNVGGIPELLDAGRGHLIDGQPGDLARALKQTFEDKTRAQAACVKARSYVVEKHDFRVIARRMVQLYEEVMARWPE